VVELVLASANRDEQRYDNPDRFDIERPVLPHQAFGNGAHFCSGHFFSRHVERIMLEELLPAAPNVRLDPSRRASSSGWIFRGPKTLPVLFGAEQ
jgi:cytochrome P450